MTSIQAPTNCPSCSSDLEWVNHLLYCRNTSCGAQSQKKVEHFAKTLKIKGLGPAAIAKLGLSDVDMIYDLTQQQIAECLSSEKLAEKLFVEIENSRRAPLDLLLPAFSIPLIGTTATAKLSKVCNSINDINTETCELAGLGPKATESLISWLERDFYCFYDGYLPFDFKFSKKVVDAIQPIGIVCISGKLKSFKTKAEAEKFLNDSGYVVKSTLTKDCTHLLNESGVESAKTKTARSRGVTVVDSIDQLIINGETLHGNNTSKVD